PEAGVGDGLDRDHLDVRDIDLVAEAVVEEKRRGMGVGMGMGMRIGLRVFNGGDLLGNGFHR
ncbi:hypothetical protein DVA79_21695, partial [Acinetobacter baumannii]